MRAWQSRMRADAWEYPAGWEADLQHMKASQSSAVAVVVHVHYPWLLADIMHRLRLIDGTFDLFITNSSGEDLVIPEGLLPNVGRLAILTVPNRGRDILPLAYLVNAGLLDACVLVLKVHTKVSAWRESHALLAGDGDEWRGSLLKSLVGNQTSIGKIRKMFEDDADIGAVSAPANVLGPEHWGDNLEAVMHLARRVGMRFRREDLQFIAGSMYWARGALVRSLRDLHLSADDFEPESGQVDGTTAHALERWIGLRATSWGMKLVETPPIKGPP